MKKALAAILLAGLAAFTIAGITNNDKNSKTGTNEPAPTSTAPSPTTTEPNTSRQEAQAKEKAACLEASYHIQDGLTAMADGFELLPYADRATAREFLATAREFTQTSIQTIQLCAEFAPAEAAETITGLRELDRLLDQAERLYG